MKTKTRSDFSKLMRREKVPATRGDSSNASPCAACRLLRKRCGSECPFAPYFPSDNPQKFAVVHQVYGTRNLCRMIMEVPESQRSDMVDCLVYEATERIRDPVYGCVRYIAALMQQLRSSEMELAFGRAQLENYRNAEMNANIIPAIDDSLFTSEVGFEVAPAASAASTTISNPYMGADDSGSTTCGNPPSLG